MRFTRFPCIARAECGEIHARMTYTRAGLPSRTLRTGDVVAVIGFHRQPEREVIVEFEDGAQAIVWDGVLEEIEG